jgi:thioredoxin reductase (NADPH)
LGGGDTAMEEAIFLTRFAEKVTIIHRREEFRASPIMVERAKKNPKISFLLNKEVVEFIGDQTVKTVRLKDRKTGKTEDVAFDGVFVAIGHTPATAFLKDVVTMDEKGYIQIRGMRSATEAHSLTSVEGIFAAGDCVDMRYRQGIVAAGMGAMAALDVEKYLES